jgi:hypothetical protein
VGGQAFPVDKKYLFRAFRVFRDRIYLLSVDDYEVETQVSPEVFQAFLDCVRDDTLPISEENCEPFWFLADEFEIDWILEKCDSMMASHQRVSPEAKLPDLPSIHRKVNVGPGHRVILKSTMGPETYDRLNSLGEIKDFVVSLEHTKEDDIVIEGIEGKDRLVEKAVAAVYANAEAAFPENRMRKPFLVAALWELQMSLSQWSIDAMIFCLNQLDEIAPTTLEKAHLLLLSQCNPVYPDKFIQLPSSNEVIIRDAIRMLQREENTNREGVDALLTRLKDTGEYERLLETDE